MEGSKQKHPVLREARRQFSAYYEEASADEESSMDNLVLAYYSFRRGIAVPRELLPAGYRATFERACDGAERKFMRARDQVRHSEAFNNLPPEVRLRIACALFEPIPLAVE